MLLERRWLLAALLADALGCAVLARHLGGQTLGLPDLHGLAWLLAAALHAVATALALVSLWRAGAGLRGRARWQACESGAALCLLLPLAGPGLLLLANLWWRWLARVGRAQRFATLAAPSYRAAASAGSGLRVGERRQQLSEVQLPLPARMKALLALQQAPSRYAAPVLREMLRDGSEDLRLLAYSMLNSKEQALAQRIDRCLGRYRQLGKDQPQAQYVLARELAELYWEMVYQNLAQGEVRRLALEQVRQYAATALRLRKQDAGLWITLGRARLLQGDREGAGAAFSSAVALGANPARVAPYMAEMAFQQGDYAAVRQQLRGLLQGPLNQSLRQLVTYWAV